MAVNQLIKIWNNSFYITSKNGMSISKIILINLNIDLLPFEPQKIGEGGFY